MTRWSCRTYPAAILAAVASFAAAGHCRAARPAEPPRSGLVLWLDAADLDGDGRLDSATSHEKGQTVSVWTDRSCGGLAARQDSPACRPLRVWDKAGRSAAVQFDGDDYLTLGRPAALRFASGKPFTVVAVFAAARADKGTIASWGGGSAGERGYQLWAAPGKLGALRYCGLHEFARRGGVGLAVMVCDGKRVRVFLNGREGASFAAGRAKAESKADVLIGARRAKADGTGVGYPLTGEVREVLIYSRALGEADLAALTKYLAGKHSTTGTPMVLGTLDERVRKLQAAGKSLDLAELLWQTATRNKLTDAQAEIAARLLDDEDPFARGLAEWALARKVGFENNGQTARWPGENPPAWFRKYMALSPERRIEADWVRQAVARGLHRDPRKLAADVAERAVQAPGRVSEPPSGAGPAEMRRAWLAMRRAVRPVILQCAGTSLDQIVFVTQFSPHTVRNITRSYAWKHKPGGDICVLRGALGEVSRAGGGGSGRGMGVSPMRPTGVPPVPHAAGTPMPRPAARLAPIQAGRLTKILRGRLGPGYVWGMDLWWDADRVVFGYAKLPTWPPPVDTAQYYTEGTNVHALRKIFPPIRLFEAKLDSAAPAGVRQLTSDPYWSDFEPTYLADGRIVFASDRCGRSAECGTQEYDHSNPNLYVREVDGRVRKLTDNRDIDRYPHALADGRVAYTHWEYQERHFMEVHALWTARPDGRASDAVFKHHMRAPLALRDTRGVPGSRKLVSVATGHHTFAYGPIVLLDPARGLNEVSGLHIVTPGVKPQEGPMAGVVVGQKSMDAGGLYQGPLALSEDCFLACYSYARPNCSQPAGVDSNGFGLYLVDVYGNRELLYRDPLYSCAYPMPLRSRRRPPVLADVTAPTGREAADKTATCYVTDVYDGMQGVARGTIKYLRVAQHVGWPFDAAHGAMHYIDGTAGQNKPGVPNWSPVRVLGEVPVEADGSASFRVPADTAIYFQALDADHMEVVRMRSMVSLAPGETRGCRGCHESQAAAPAVRGPAASSAHAHGPSGVPIALRRPARPPVPPAWGADRLLGYEWLVQPVLDKHCVRCHGGAKPKAGLDLTSRRTHERRMNSYWSLLGVTPAGKRTGKPLVALSNRFSHADVSKPRQFGSSQSRLIQMIRGKEHAKRAKLTPQEWLALVTWVDANAPYYDAFVNKRPHGPEKPGRTFKPNLAVAAERKQK